MQLANGVYVADCAKPMLWAEERKIEVDVFVIYTNQRGGGTEGGMTPVAALNHYREAMKRPNTRYMYNCFGRQLSKLDSCLYFILNLLQTVTVFRADKSSSVTLTLSTAASVFLTHVRFLQCVLFCVISLEFSFSSCCLLSD